VDSVSSGKFLVSVKGAPEILKPLFKNAPENFDSTFKYFVTNGYRVLAIGFKWMDYGRNAGPGFFRTLARSEVESELEFGGFLVFNCPLKSDALASVQELQESMHRASTLEKSFLMSL
jgi:cation-transporting ATPase 13A1